MAFSQFVGEYFGTSHIPANRFFKIGSTRYHFLDGMQIIASSNEDAVREVLKVVRNTSLYNTILIDAIDSVIQKPFFDDASMYDFDTMNIPNIPELWSYFVDNFIDIFFNDKISAVWLSQIQDSEDEVLY